MIKKLHDDVLEMEILPMEEPPTELLELAEAKKEKPVLEDKDVFKEEIEENEPDNAISLEIAEKPTKVKKGTGQRGPDKQKRAKPRVTQKRLDSLQRARDASVLRRQALAEEKKRLKAEINEKAKANLDKTVSFEELKPQPPPKSDQENFFTLMDQWDTRKQERKTASRATIQKQSGNLKKCSSAETARNHPASTSIAALARPKPPDNPFDELFNYTQKNTFW